MSLRLRSSEDARCRPHEAWSIDFCVKKHLSEDKFDGFQYSFVLAKHDEVFFAQRHDQAFYVNLVKRHPLKQSVVEFFLANRLAEVGYVASMTDENLLALRRDWDILSRIFTAECQLLATQASLNHLLQSDNGQYPLVIAEYLRKRVSIHTVAILHLLTHFLKSADKRVSDPMLWPDLSLRIRKYSTFLREIDLEKFRDIGLSEFAESTK